ncbi:MAG: hypothetical protein ACTSP9_14095, partial [Promethearchaeota archaeon]
TDTKYELEIKFGETFPEFPPEFIYYDAIKDLLGEFELEALTYWSEDTTVVDILNELKRTIEGELEGGKEGDMEPINPFMEQENVIIEELPDIPNIPNISDKTQESKEKPDEQDYQDSEDDEEFITPDLNAYPPDFEVEQYITPSTDESQYIESDSRIEELPIEQEEYDQAELLDTDQSSLIINTELGLIQQEYAYDHVGSSKTKIIVYLTITLTKTFMVEIDLKNYPKKLSIKLPQEVELLLGEPNNILESLKNWKGDESTHVVEVLRDLETKLFFIKEIETESKKIIGEYRCDPDPNNPTKLKVHLVTYGFKEYIVDVDLAPYPKAPSIHLSTELQNLINLTINELKAFQEWKEDESESVEVLREIAWLVDKNSRINFEVELLKEHYKDIQFDPSTQILLIDMKGKMKTQDLTFKFQIRLPNDYPMKMPEIKVLNEFEFETHEKTKNDLQSSFKSFFEEWTPFKYLVDLFNVISKKIFEVSVVSCVICHKIDCPTCSLKIAGPDEEACHTECPYCERSYHKHCWEQTIKSFGKCGFCLKVPPPNLMPS